MTGVKSWREEGFCCGANIPWPGEGAKDEDEGAGTETAAGSFCGADGVGVERVKYVTVAVSMLRTPSLCAFSPCPHRHIPDVPAATNP